MLPFFVREAHFSTCPFVFHDYCCFFGAALRAALICVKSAAVLRAIQYHFDGSVSREDGNAKLTATRALITHCCPWQ